MGRKHTHTHSTNFPVKRRSELRTRGTKQSQVYNILGTAAHQYFRSKPFTSNKCTGANNLDADDVWYFLLYIKPYVSHLDGRADAPGSVTHTPLAPEQGGMFFTERLPRVRAASFREKTHEKALR